MTPAQKSMVREARETFHASLLKGPLTVDETGIPSIADKGNRKSIELSKAIVERIGTASVQEKKAGQTAGDNFEGAVTKYISSTFGKLHHLRPGTWNVEQGGGAVSRFSQLSHLADLQHLISENPKIRASISGDYMITPDVVVSRLPEPDEQLNAPGTIIADGDATLTPLRAANNPLPLLHATISCKWTIRSDRVQNTRTEAQNLIRNRKGHVPHIVAVTAEPLPSRLAAIALGTADLDCLYHFALNELVDADQQLEYNEDMLALLIEGKRIRDISDLPLDLAI
jgi:hypothetical protein